MIIQVTGTGTANKGAELLLVAIKQQLATSLPHAQLAVTPDFGSFDERARYGLRTVLPEVPKGRWWLAGKMMPKAFRQSNGLVSESDVNAVLDASGFAFGDQLGAVRVEKFATDVKRWKKQGKPVVLLPQALGPFENCDVRAAFQDVAESVDLIFARERISFEHTAELGVSSSKLRQAPDFTNLVKCPDVDGSAEHHALLIPNYQMIAKTDQQQSEKYVPFLARCFRQLTNFGFNPAVLLHDDRIDRQLVDPLRAELGADIPVLTRKNPVELKAVLGQAKLVVGSRFHALVGALSQGVPTIAVGWSHKYQMLLTDYGCEDSVLTVDSNDDEITELIQRINSEWDIRQQRTWAAAEKLKVQSQEMWEAVRSTLASNSPVLSITSR